MKTGKGRKSKNVEDRRPGSMHLRSKIYGNESPEQEATRKEISRKMDARLNNGYKTQIKSNLRQKIKNREI